MDTPSGPSIESIFPRPTIPGYEIVDELGRGGMAVVYKAQDLRLKRLVALKMILRGPQADLKELARFRTEAEVVARLQHPHIIQIHEIGEHEGLPFLSLEYVEGGSLARKLDGTPWPAPPAARLIKTLAEAIHAAHQCGVVHRDLKPGNVLLTGEDFPKITDFGLAKRLDITTAQTETGQILGTPSYLAPEQAGGVIKRIGPAADVYALGAILYELVTGRPPFKTANVIETLTMVLSDDPVPPGRFQQRLPRDIETICLKCLDKQPGRRYGSAQELAEDLGRFLAGQPIQARPATYRDRILKWVRRRPDLAAALAGVILVTLVAGSLVAWQWHKAVVALIETQREKKERALAQIDALCTATPGAVPTILAGLQASQHEVMDSLQDRFATEQDRHRRMRLALALLSFGADRVRDDLADWMLEVEEPGEVLLVRDTLQPQRRDLLESLWRKSAHGSSSQRFRALVALAAFDPDGPGWSDGAAFAVEQLVTANPLHLGLWVGGLRPAREHLLAPLSKVFRGDQLPERRQVAATILANHAAGRPDDVAGLLLDADGPQYETLWLALEKKHLDRLAQLMRSELASRPEAAHSEADQERQARRQATAAATLLRLAEPEPVWPLFRHGPDPTRRSYLVQRAGSLGADPKLLVGRLMVETDVSARRALILALGEHTEKDLPAGERGPLVQKLLAWYHADPDPGVHGAIDWLLRHDQEGPRPRPFDWGQREALEAIDARLACRGAGPPGTGEYGWLVNGQRQTFTFVRGPVTARMGLLTRDPDGNEEPERPHLRHIPRSFAIAAKPVTVAQWRCFLDNRPEARKSYRSDPKSSRASAAPVTSVAWYEAAMYCNWLSEVEGIPPDQWCYPEPIVEGFIPYPDYLQRRGYRLPTEAEWEFACRAGSETARYYGSPLELLHRYGISAANGGNRAWPVGQMRPNDLGMFDMLGNVWTWCQDQVDDGLPDGRGVDREDVRPLSDKISRAVRGGAFDIVAAEVRSAKRIGVRPSNRIATFGLRVCRTCAAAAGGQH